jgi:hypothetical protein
VLFPAFLQVIKDNVEARDLKSLKTILKHFWLMTKVLNEDNKVSKNYMSEGHFNALGPLLSKGLTIIKEAKAQTLKTISSGKKNFDIDEEDLERVKEELARICIASTYVMEISGQLVLNFKEAAALNGYKELTESELLDATCFFCDFIEYAYHKQPEAVSMITELNSKFLEIFNSGDDIATIDVKQTLSYGMGVFATSIPSIIYSQIAP